MNDATPPASNTRIDSWKGIARYLGRSVRTVRRWETERALPVHRLRHDSQHSVYAWPQELDAWLRSRTVERPAAGKTVCAVQPFLARGAGPVEQLAATVTQEIASLLGAEAQEEFDIVSVGPGTDPDRTIDGQKGQGERREAAYTVGGSVACTQADLFRIEIRITQAGRDRPVFEKEYVCRLENIRSVQRHLADSILRALTGDAQSAAEDGVCADYGVPAGAYEAYLRGCSLIAQLTPEAMRKAVEEFDTATGLDEEFAEAYAQKALALVLSTVYGPTAPNTVMPLAMDACARALAASPQRAEAHLALAMILWTYRYDWRKAEQAIGRALDINPSLSPAWQWRAELRASLGRFDEALADIERARQLDPASLAVASSKGYVLVMARRDEETIAAMDDVLSRDPNHFTAHIQAGLACAHLGDFDRAADYFADGAARSGGFADLRALNAYALARAGRTEEACAIHAELRHKRSNDGLGAVQDAFVHLGLGEYERVLDALETTYEQRLWHVSLLAHEAIFDPLRGHPRFRALLGEIGLEEVAFHGRPARP